MINWGEIFFALHKHCNLNKWEIWEYTLPQVIELMKSVSRYIKFEAQIRATPFGLFGGVADENEEDSTQIEEDGYKVATAEDIDLFASFLGGF